MEYSQSEIASTTEKSGPVFIDATIDARFRFRVTNIIAQINANQSFWILIRNCTGTAWQLTKNMVIAQEGKNSLAVTKVSEETRLDGAKCLNIAGE